MERLNLRKLLLGIFLIGIAILLVYCVITLWPTSISVDISLGEPVDEVGQEIDLDANNKYDPKEALFGIDFEVGDEARLVILVLLVGALGAYIHAATSFGRWVGTGKFETSWFWWYLLRVPIGMALAFLFYLVIRGGFLAAGTNAGEVNLYGVTAIAGIVGLFSRQAIEKLAEVFDDFFLKRSINKELDKPE